MKDYQFKIKVTGIGFGVLRAKDLEAAKKKIKEEEWDDILDINDCEYGEVIEIIEESAAD